MDKAFTSDAERLLIFLRKLKEVFDVCDEDSDGFILPEHLVSLGCQFGHTEQVKTFAKCLDPHCHGRINFKDFCKGVLSVKGYDEICKKITSVGTLIKEGPYKTHNSYNQIFICAYEQWLEV
ncbi:hypothetical protein LDENG_00072450 [Lucifuga dentata]|nr:hypothetical protein LDENG_00072450 [Lucifuga dentata]